MRGGEGNRTAPKERTQICGRSKSADRYNDTHPQNVERAQCGKYSSQDDGLTGNFGRVPLQTMMTMSFAKLAYESSFT